jgi:catechol 2,3-dioxygenase-like lactoylglutathione lyase family enzyme
MNASIDSLLTRYETGTLTRRELIAAIGLVAMPRKTEAQNGMFRARTLHHVNIGVADVSRSEDFYRELLGFSERRYIVGDAYAMDFPDGGLISLCPAAGGNCSLTADDAVPGQIDHFGIGIENFDADRVSSELNAAGVEGVRQAGQTSVLVPDPDGVIVQLSAPTERFEGAPRNRDC